MSIGIVFQILGRRKVNLEDVFPLILLVFLNRGQLFACFLVGLNLVIFALQGLLMEMIANSVAHHDQYHNSGRDQQNAGRKLA